MAGWFGNISLDVDTPAPVNVTPNTGGASWGTSGSSLTITIKPGNRDANHIRYLLISEMTEQFMRAQGKGWFGNNTEGSQGEGLSRFLAGQFLLLDGLSTPPSGFSNSNTWLASPRADSVNNINTTDDGPSAPTGCSLLFLYYLFTQLGFSINQIVTAGGNDLGKVYRSLTGENIDPFPFFKRMLDVAFPGTSTISGTNVDDPYPLGLMSFWVDKSTYGRDEVQDVIDAIGGTFQDAFWLVIEGFNLNQFSARGINPSAFAGAFASIPGVTVTRSDTPIDFENPANAKAPQRVRIAFDITFTATALNAFPSTGAAPIALDLSAFLTTGGSTKLRGSDATTVFDLVAGADPYFTNINPSQNNVFYLSQDLRVFTATPALNNTPVAGAPAFGTDSVAGAFSYIQSLIAHLNANFNDPTGTDPFNSVLPGQNNSLAGDSSVTPFTLDLSSFFFPRVVSNYNFAIARVRLRGTAGPSGAAQDVKVFFRLWSTQSADTDFQPETTYQSNLDGGGHPDSPRLGSDHRTIPFFATGNLGANSDYGAGGVNNRTVQINSGDNAWAYFGCFLNLYDTANVIDGQAVQRWLNGTHHCMVAEIAYDDAPILTSNGVTMSPENSDKLAQRNLQITLSDNPGPAATHRISQTFDTRPSAPLANVVGSLLDYPDELMIDWGDVPEGSVANIYWPAVSANDVLNQATRLYGSHRLTAGDPNTIRCQVTRGVTYVPIPPSGTTNAFAGLLTVDLPQTVVTGQEFNVIVRRVATRRLSKPPVIFILTGERHGDASSVEPLVSNVELRSTSSKKSAKRLARSGHIDESPDVPEKTAEQPEANWRYVTGTFQVKIPITTPENILPADQDTLAIMKWRLNAMPTSDRWNPVLLRYISYLSDRVAGLGGNPDAIPPSLQGAPRTTKRECDDVVGFTGKVLEVIYDCFGDLEGFVVGDCCERRAFRTREPEIGTLVLRALKERLLVSVFTNASDPVTLRRMVIRA